MTSFGYCYTTVSVTAVSLPSRFSLPAVSVTENTDYSEVYVELQSLEQRFRQHKGYRRESTQAEIGAVCVVNKQELLK